MDPKDKKLADLLTAYSCRLEKDENILIEYEGDESVDLVRQIVKNAYAVGAKPYVNIDNSIITRELLLGARKDQLEFMNEYLLHQMKEMNAYIAIRSNSNTSELSDVPSEQLNLYSRELKPVLDQRVDHSKWVILRYPNPSMAQLAGTSQETFRDFYYDVCTLDYGKMSQAMNPLKKLMEKTDNVQIKGPGTDLTFSIKGIPAVKCSGECNIPDGEVYTAPVKNSVNGVITYNTPSEEQGFTYENIRFEIENGKIVKATANDNTRINALLDTDPGARYFGEFALGVNPYILHPMKDTLFDEKICGSLHLTPGEAYDDAPNGNSSAVHWDLVLIQREDYGGGEIYFDDKLIRKDGRFVIPQLEGLNPENLK